MTVDRSLDKERVDFAHNYTKIRVKCPECVKTIKGNNHVRIYKSLAGLWRHIKLEHGEISNLQYNTSTIKEVLKNISRAVDWGFLLNSSKNHRKNTIAYHIHILNKKNILRENLSIIHLIRYFNFFVKYDMLYCGDLS